MKKVLLALFISTLLIYGSIQASAAQLSFSNVQITPGSNSVMDLSISETDRHYSGVNIAFTLPEGVTVTNITNGALLPAEKYSVEFNAYTTGGAKVVVYSPNDTFSTDGKLLQIELSADASAIPGNYNIEFEANSSTLINSSHAISGQSGVTSVAHDVSVGLLTINNGDSDNDQMKDSWEIANFGNLDQTGTIDSDNDGLTDLQEYQNDTNPNSKDTDSDGMDDGWEVANGLNPKSDDTLLDSDGDGFSNIAEYLAGTDPKSGTDIPVKLAITETFESGDLKTLNWKNSSIPWLVTGAGPKNGFNSVESPAIEDKTNGNLELSMYCQQGDISFWYRVSSEKDYDYLKFYIDDVFQGGWSGEVAYTQASYAVAKGMHTFKWVYSKDGSGSSGEDLAMLDDIIFPGSLDSDSDGMPNSWEVENNLNPAVNDALEDFDSDGFSNFAEFVAGSDPSDINSKPVFTDKTEDFESGILSNPFVLSGDGEWSIVDSEGFSSTKGFKSPALSDKKSASFENTMYCESGDVSFRVSVSSEEFDYLYFYIDGELKGNWSGDVPYTQVSFPVTAGMHTFKWKYSKDGADSGGTDNALIDDITFPGSLDSDSDGMPDGWEIINKLNPMFNDAGIDSDNDGFINLHEYYANTDPNVHDDTISYPVPVANAGSDQTVTEGVEVTLDGSLSTGVGTVSYKWRQVSGTVVTLSDDTLAKPTFTAPTETLVFELIVEDVGGLTNSSTVNIIINK